MNAGLGSSTTAQFRGHVSDGARSTSGIPRCSHGGAESRPDGLAPDAFRASLPDVRPSDPAPVGLTRHEAAVRRTLDLAEESAARGDYRDALAWLAAIEATGDRLPAPYVERQAAWTLAAPDLP